MGQFYTKNSKYILSGITGIIPEDVVVVDPFAGENDLLNLLPNNNKIAYDIEPQQNNIIKRDTLKAPPNYNNQWIITNPPYLARNKNKEKYLYDKYSLDDLYKIAIKTLIGCEGGILILPINFFSSIDCVVRKEFLSKYIVKQVNVFEEQVFNDTSYTICSFSFIKENNTEQEVNFTFFPSKKYKKFVLKEENDYTFGKEIYNLPEANIKVGRLLIGQKPTSNLFLRAVDTGNNEGRIKLRIEKEFYFGKNTDRTFATISLSKSFTLHQQKKIVDIFNSNLNYFRDKYNSLFLPNYRDKYRKRIPFKLAYHLISNAIFLFDN